MATVKEVLERVNETNSKLDDLNKKIDEYKDGQNTFNNELEKRVMKLEDRHENCRADVTRQIDELRPERRRDRLREWLLFILTLAGVVTAVLIPMSYLIQRIVSALPKGNG